MPVSPYVQLSPVISFGFEKMKRPISLPAFKAGQYESPSDS
jgi:hypothetical protein